MNNLIANIVQLFTSVTVDNSKIEENLTEVKLSTLCNDLSIPTEDEFSKVITEINNRDNINISIVQNNSTCNYVQEDTDCNFNDFVENCSIIQPTSEKEIIVSITKKKTNNFISIYYIDNFTNYINSLSCAGFFLKINGIFVNNNFITFEVQNTSFSVFSTQTIKFIPKGSQTANSREINRVEKNNKIKNLCHCNLISKYQFIPDDFYPTIKNNSELDTIFGHYSLL